MLEPTGQAATAAEPVTQRPAIFVVASQVLESLPYSLCSQVVVRVFPLPEASAAGAASTTETAALALSLRVEVPGYDVSTSGPFRQLVLCASCRAMLLLAPQCCAAVALPELGAASSGGEVELRAVPLLPPGEAAFVKVLWHPLSDSHIGVLLSDGTWQLLNLAQRASLAEPEVHLPVTFGGEGEPGEEVADFTFGAPWAPGSGPAGASEAVWLAMAVLFLSSRGRLSTYNPVLPAFAVLPTAVLDSLRTAGAEDGEACDRGLAGAAASEWLRKTVLCAANRQEVQWPGAAIGSYVAVQHGLHMHGSTQAYHQRWRPAEQVIVEERAECELSPRSPRHHRSNYCSVQLLALSPLTVVARATETGMVELLVLSGMLEPRFDPRMGQGSDEQQGGLLCAVFEEVDLVLSQTKASTLRLSVASASEAGGSPLLLARSRTLVAAIEVPWIAALQRGASASMDGLPGASVTTLAEVRAADGPGEIVGWQLLDAATRPGQLARTPAPAPVRAGAGAPACAGLWLRVREKSAGSSAATPVASTAVAQAVDVRAALKAAAKARASKPTSDGSSGNNCSPAAAGTGAAAATADAVPPEREEYLRLLSTSMLQASPLFGALGTRDSGEPPAAGAVARAVATVQSGQLGQLSARQALLGHLTAQLPTRAAAVRAALSELARDCSDLRVAAEATERKASCVQERQAELEAQHRALVSALRNELELRGLNSLAASELPRLWGLLHDLRQASELLRAAAAPTSAAEGKGLPAAQLATLESLQRAWTGTAAEQLRLQTARAEAAVDMAVRAADRCGAAGA